MCLIVFDSFRRSSQKKTHRQTKYSSSSRLEAGDKLICATVRLPKTFREVLYDRVREASSGGRIIPGKHNNTKNEAPEAVVYLLRYQTYFLALFVGAGRPSFFFYIIFFFIFQRFPPLLRVSSIIHQESFRWSYA